MTLPFTWTLRGHCRVINWPSFKIIVSQGIGRPKERERDRGTAGRWNSQNTHIYRLSLPSYMTAVCGTPNNYNSNTKDHWSQIIMQIIIKSLKYCENNQNVAQRCKISKWCWKNGAKRLAWCKVATNLQFVKKMQYLQSAIKKSTIKWGMPGPFTNIDYLLAITIFN